MNDEKSLDLEFANIDLDRKERTGMQEVVYCGHKSREQIAGIASAMLERGLHSILFTRLSFESAEYLANSIGAEMTGQMESKDITDYDTAHTLFYDKDGRIGVLDRKDDMKPVGNITIVSAGTSDMPTVREAEITARLLGNNTVVINDVGVAGIHRLLSKEDELKSARVIIVIAGMEGALASVVGGLVKCPVIAVPTSVGYGASFGGVSALLSMLNSCAAGVSVVNIDNGFGAAVTASRINQMQSPE
ncbi:MAG: nickel pincer cofactor biosynthesis protein LarB [Lachnospiraceae bacterium]|nr:nickel pincer cofactor biosynthesis protein LarB [Lachnospiraceae bacterium]